MSDNPNAMVQGESAARQLNMTNEDLRALLLSDDIDAIGYVDETQFGIYRHSLDKLMARAVRVGSVGQKFSNAASRESL